MRLFRILLVCAFLLITSSVYGQDDNENLLNNPSFEQGFEQQAGDSVSQVAEGWSAWHTERQPDEPSWRNRQPVYQSVTADDGFVYDGNFAQVMFNNTWWTHDAGIYQVVSNGFEAGDRLDFSIYAYVWSSKFEDRSVSQDAGGVTLQVGIDPTGEHNPASDAIIWSDAIEQYDDFVQLTGSVIAENTTVTVWVRSFVNSPVQNSFIYLDNASLTAISIEEAFVEEPTAEATEEVTVEETTTPEDEAEVVEPTEEAIVEEPTAEATEEVTVEETATPEDEVEVVEPTEEAFVEEPTAEATEEVTVEETATPEDEVEVVDPTEEAIVEEPTAEATEEVTVEETATPEDEAEVVDPTEEAIVEETATTEEAIAEEPTGEVTEEVTVEETATPEDGVEVVEPTEEAIVEEPTVEATEEVTVEPTEEPTVIPTVTLVPTNTVVPATATPVYTNTPLPPTATPTPIVLTDEELALSEQVVHVVSRGETLARIAAAYDSTVNSIAHANQLATNSLIFIGQELIVPVAPDAVIATEEPVPTATDAPPTIEPEPIITPDAVDSTEEIEEADDTDSTEQTEEVYIVQYGDTLAKIAWRYNVTVLELAQRNAIVNVNRIYSGQQLIIPVQEAVDEPEVTVEETPTPEPTVTPVEPEVEVEPRYYTVQYGDSLSRISALFNVRIDVIAEANDIVNYHLIYPGQVLIIP